MKVCCLENDNHWQNTKINSCNNLQYRKILRILTPWSIAVVILKFEYRKTPKNLDARKIAVLIQKFEQWGSTIESCIQNMQTELQTVWVFTACSGLTVQIWAASWQNQQNDLCA